MGKSPFGEYLAHVIAGKTIEGRTISAHEVFDIARVKGSYSFRKRGVPEAVSQRVRRATDRWNFDGRRNGRIHFQINIKAAEQQKLQISSKLLELAEITER